MGVTLMRTNEDEKVVAVAKISGSEEENTEEQIDILDDYNDKDDILDELVNRAQSDSEE
jgi:DNA gyrase subunit A